LQEYYCLSTSVKWCAAADRCAANEPDAPTTFADAGSRLTLPYAQTGLSRIGRGKAALRWLEQLKGKKLMQLVDLFAQKKNEAPRSDPCATHTKD
jgi:hypothetical protein